MSIATRMTADQFLELGEDPEGVRLELVNGEVVVSPSPVPDHAYVVTKIGNLIENHSEANGLGELYNDVDTILDRFTVRRPDVLFFFKHRTHLIGKKAMEGPPDLAIEVISPSNADVDRTDKFAEYRDAGVANYWIIDPKLRTIEAWHLDAGQYVAVGRAQGTAVIKLPPFPDLEIPLSKLWRK